MAKALGTALGGEAEARAVWGGEGCIEGVRGCSAAMTTKVPAQLYIFKHRRGAHTPDLWGEWQAGAPGSLLAFNVKDLG